MPGEIYCFIFTFNVLYCLVSRLAERWVVSRLLGGWSGKIMGREGGNVVMQWLSDDGQHWEMQPHVWMSDRLGPDLANI